MEATFPCLERQDEEGMKRTERDTERYSQIVSGWSKVQEALSLLERLRDGSSLDPHFKDDIHTFKSVMKILIPLLGCISKWKTEDLNSNYSPGTLAYVLEHVIQKSEAFLMESLNTPDAEDLNSYSTAAGIVATNLEVLRSMKPEIRKLLRVISGSSKPLTTGEAPEVVRFINLLLENLNDMLCFEDDLIMFLKEQIEALQNRLMFLRNFLGFLSEICIQHNFLVDLLSFAEARAVDASCVLYFILVNEMNGEEQVKIQLLCVVEKIKPFSEQDLGRIYVKALEASRSMIKGPSLIGEFALRFFDSLIHNLREPSNEGAYFEVASKDQIENLLKRLSFIRYCIEETPPRNHKEGVENFMTELLDLIVDLGCFICSNKGLQAQEKLGNLLDKIQFIESASGDLLVPRSWQCNFPKTNEFGFIDFILLNLRERLDFNMVPTDLLNCSIDTLYEALLALRRDFSKISGLCKEKEELRSLLTQYKDVAYQVEYFSDLSLSATEFSAYQRFGLTGLSESIRQISGKVKAIRSEMIDEKLATIADSLRGVSLEAHPASSVAAKCPKHETGSHPVKGIDQLVGLEDGIENIKGQLLRGSKQLQILSIVGMPGIGKTTLASSVYGEPAVALHFHARAWCTVSQVYQKEYLLNEILRQVRRETNQDLEKNDKGLDQQLYQSLKGRRYLVILDDIWEAEVWADLRLFFPNDSNGSRVVFTTRNYDVAIQSNSVPHALQLLSDEESWVLLHGEVFKKETCPAELLQVGKKIAEDCRGLPLSVVLIAGILKTTERKQGCWEGVAKQLKTYVVDYPSGQQSGTLELSYMHLPDHLKPCFLYFGAFREDTEIPVHKLVNLWVAEGFVQQPKGDEISLEYEAGNYLNALIDRSLVILSKRS